MARRVILIPSRKIAALIGKEGKRSRSVERNCSHFTSPKRTFDLQANSTTGIVQHRHEPIGRDLDRNRNRAKGEDYPSTAECILRAQRTGPKEALLKRRSWATSIVASQFRTRLVVCFD